MMDAPIYLRIAEEYKEKIKNNQLKANWPLPSEAALCESFQVSRLTLRKSLQLLMKEGFIYLLPGKGYYVREINNDRFSLTYNEVNFGALSIDRLSIISVDIVPATAVLVYYLQIHPKNRVLQLKRRLHAGSRVVGCDNKYIPYYAGIPLEESEIVGRDFAQILSGRVSPYRLERKLSITSTTPDAETARVLGVAPAAPLLEVREQLIEKELGVAGYGITYYNPEHIQLTAQWER